MMSNKESQLLRAQVTAAYVEQPVAATHKVHLAKHAFHYNRPAQSPAQLHPPVYLLPMISCCR